jgi:hypothetical protein
MTTPVMTPREVRHKLKSLEQALIMMREVAVNPLVAPEKRELATTRIAAIEKDIRLYQAMLPPSEPDAEE